MKGERLDCDLGSDEGVSAQIRGKRGVCTEHAPDLDLGKEVSGGREEVMPAMGWLLCYGVAIVPLLVNVGTRQLWLGRETGQSCRADEQTGLLSTNIPQEATLCQVAWRLIMQQSQGQQAPQSQRKVNALPTYIGVLGIVIVTCLLIFTEAGGPEWLLAQSVPALWAFLWGCVAIVPAGGRSFTIMIAGIARGDSPRAILRSQVRGCLVIVSCVVIATAVTLNPAMDFYVKSYVNYVALGIGTNLAMAEQNLRKGGRMWPAPRAITVLVMALGAVAVCGLGVDVYMVSHGGGYAYGLLGWLFAIVAEPIVRTVVPPCYDYLSYWLVSYVRAGRAEEATGWERLDLAAGSVVKGVGWLIGFIILGGWIATQQSDLYRFGHTGLPANFKALLAIIVVARAYAYFVGGFGSAWTAGLGDWVIGLVKPRRSANSNDTIQNDQEGGDQQ